MAVEMNVVNHARAAYAALGKLLTSTKRAHGKYHPEALELEAQRAKIGKLLDLYVFNANAASAGFEEAAPLADEYKKQIFSL